MALDLIDTMTSESLVVIRTFGNLLAADEAQIELLTAGIHSLLLSDDTAELEASAIATCEPIALAVHRRDADVAWAVLTPPTQPS